MKFPRTSPVVLAFFLAPPVAYAGPLKSLSMLYDYTTVNDPADLTFNQLLGINNLNNIAGYYGSGMNGHPNKGYVMNAPNYLNSIVDGNFPNSAQTQDTCISNLGQVGGFWIDGNGTTLGFVREGAAGRFNTVVHPQTGSGTVNQILSVNDGNYAVGFYQDSMGTSHAYSYNIATKSFANITPPVAFGCTSTTATGTNNLGDVVGFCTTSTNTTVSFFANNGNYVLFEYPGSKNTQILGINNNRTFVGSYEDTAGAMHGFVAQNPQSANTSVASLDHPNGSMGTVVNGLNDAGVLVGFYVDASGNTNGMVATPGGSGLISTAPMPSFPTPSKKSKGMAATSAATSSLPIVASNPVLTTTSVATPISCNVIILVALMVTFILLP